MSTLVTQLLPHLNQAMDKRPIKLALPVLKPVPLAAAGVTFLPAALSIPTPSGIQLIPRIDSKGLRVLVIASIYAPPNSTSPSDVTLQQAVFGRLRPQNLTGLSDRFLSVPVVTG